jgi:hypothetical protein
MGDSLAAFLYAGRAGTVQKFRALPWRAQGADVIMRLCAFSGSWLTDLAADSVILNAAINPLFPSVPPADIKQAFTVIVSSGSVRTVQLNRTL